MEARNTTRLIMLGALALSGCQLRIDPSILPTVAPTTPGPTATTTSPRPTPTATTTAVPTTRPGRSPIPTIAPIACASPSDTVVGSAMQGAYNGQRLPGGFDGLQSEGEVTQAIGRVDGNGDDWTCFQQHYPGASTVYQSKKGGVIGYPVSPPPTPIIEDWILPPPCAMVATNTVAINGMVFDEQGVPFPSGVEVRVRNKDHSFTQDAIVENGHYYVYGAPAGVKLEITAVHQDTGEARRRFVVPAAFYQDCGNEGFSVVNFGGPKTAEDAVGHRYPLPTVDAVIKADVATLSGEVFDLWGKPLDGARVTVSSLVKGTAYTGVAMTSGGRYEVTGIPAGVPMEIRAEYQGYRARARADVFFAGDGGKKGNVVNFGGDPTIQDPQGPQYALAPLPPDGVRKAVVVKGKVRDIDGRVVSRGKIVIRSLAPEVPYEAVVELVDGNYVVNNVPATIEVEFMLESAGFEPTWRYERLGGKGGAVNFGTPEDGDPEGASYGLVEEVEEE